jgi:hypothetical protein
MLAEQRSSSPAVLISCRFEPHRLLTPEDPCPINFGDGRQYGLLGTKIVDSRPA